jgi:hypothetical protein
VFSSVELADATLVLAVASWYAQLRYMVCGFGA